MDIDELGPEQQAILRSALGYLNFSSGAADAAFRRNINELFAAIESPSADSRASRNQPTWQVLRDLLSAELATLVAGTDTFRESQQAAATLSLVFDHTLPAYRAFHTDLLHHQTPESLFRPFFVARACEAVLRQEGPWEEADRIVSGAIAELNDFIGHRPLAVLHSRKIEPYAHEWVCPIPLYFRDAGVAVGRYREVIEQALEILRETEKDVLDRAHFDPALLDELALDPRAYDFDHPANKRPNYHFGQWDPHHIDNAGQYRRFVLQDVTLDALCQRFEHGVQGLPVEELKFEAAAVLAGTILMAAGVSGRGPGSHDSATTLATLLPRIVAYRDAFYERLLARVAGSHGERLRAEALALRQPLGQARQDLNARLTRLRATQLQHVHLAQLFAQMGYRQASAEQAEIVPVASARMLCQTSGRITAGHLALDRAHVAETAQSLSEITELLRRAIECGAMVDPWNMLGFQGQFSLFPALENSVGDHRVDVLVHVVAQVLGLYVRTIGEAAAAGESNLQQRLTLELEMFANWWDRFASTEVSGVDHVRGQEAVEAAAGVASALSAWHSAGAAAGDVAIWRKHVEGFNSARAYALVVTALLEKRDFVASMALLVQWLSQAEVMPLAEGEHSFGYLAMTWLSKLGAAEAVAAKSTLQPSISQAERWTLVAKFFDYLEANAGPFWGTPTFLGREVVAPPTAEAGPSREPELAGDDDDAADEDLFGAAYEEMTYRDTTGDGVEGDTLDEDGPTTDYELDHEARRLAMRLDFLGTLARLWQRAATLAIAPDEAGLDVLRDWLRQAGENRRRLLDLLTTVQAFRVPAPSGAQESLVEFERRRMVKDALSSRVVAAYVATAAAQRAILATAGGSISAPPESAWESMAAEVLGTLLRGDAAAARALFPALQHELAEQPVLYVPLSKGGDPRRLAAAQSLLQVLSELLAALPRVGLLNETCQLLETVAEAEKRRPGGESAITEFDRLFEIGYQGIVACLAESAAAWEASTGDERSSDSDLVDCLQAVSEPLLRLWLAHSRLVRLSSLEKLADQPRWQAVVELIERYGHDLFTQRFMNFGNLRGILNQGVDKYLRAVEDESDAPPRLVEDLDRGIARTEAAELLGLALEAVVENYSEYKDFNATTTQSDRGELLYVLLDFLRLKAGYQRFAWNIRPVVMAHEILVARGRTSAAELWRRAVADRTAEAADWHQARLVELEKKHRVRLATISDRLAERFVRPLSVDRLRALVRPAIEEMRLDRPQRTFSLLQQELAEFLERPSGSGLDVPGWLSALEHEAELALAGMDANESDVEVLRGVPQACLTRTEVERQLRELEGE